MRALLLLLSFPLVAGCVGPFAIRRTEHFLSMVGPDHHLVRTTYESQEPDVRREAAIDLACPAASLVVEERAMVQYVSVFRVTGCGRSVTFVGGGYDAVVERLPEVGEGGVSDVYITRYFIIDEHTVDAIAAFDAAVHRLPLTHDTQTSGSMPVGPELRAVHAFADLAVAAVRDVPCPFDQLSIDVVDGLRSVRDFLATGCGFRAQFVRDGSGALVITSRVALAPP